MSAMSKLFDLAGLKSAVANVGKEHRRLSAEVEKLRVKREDTASAPANRQDLIRAIDGWIDSQLAGYERVLSERLLTIGQRAENLEGGFGSVPSHHRRLLGLDPGPHAKADADFVQPGALMLLVGTEPVKSALRNVIAGLEIQNEGLPLAKRRAALEKLDREIGDAEEQLANMRQEAADAGVFLDEERLP